MALYRKYRPASFAEVVGQEHVTKPLSLALDNGRINHAYLFSGPRGCGKTSSARILARSLNCEQGPTSTPCGVCNSCRSLAPGGPGNLDVMELDAASNRGVEDMRELRDRAYYAPAESRYRVFIIDEAHMITREGSNALLKIVEEPPEHLIFIFATTEPEKVIGTIRSRTHHYPFRLLTPPAMRGLLQRTCDAEGIAIEDSVFPLIISAGGGSPRDSLSILDQLLAGSGPDGITYDLAVPILGVTDSALIDGAINALISNDKAAMFTTVDDVISAGHDPRRFVSDLLNRLRDLMILQAVPQAFELGLVDVPESQQPILQSQASSFHGNQLARLTDLVNERIDDMRGATSSRLLLEILCARLLLPQETQIVTTEQVTPQQQAPQQQQPAAAAPRRVFERKSVREAREAQAQPAQQAAPQKAAEPVEQKPVEQKPVAPIPAAEKPAAQQPATEDITAKVKEKWSDIRSLVAKRNSVAGIMLTEAKVLGIRDNELVIGHHTGALAERLNSSSNNDSIKETVNEVLGTELTVTCVVGTNPEKVGFVKQPAPQKAWSPSNPEPAKQDTAKEETPPEDPEPAATPKPVWGAPAKLGGASPVDPQPEPEKKPAPVADESNVDKQGEGAPKKRWQLAAERGQQQLQKQTVNEVPLPPEPPMDEPPPADAPPPSDPYDYPPDEGIPGTANVDKPLSEEEELIRDAASAPGELDHRDARTIAMEMLEKELGARPL